MSNLNIETILFAAYKFDTGQWVKWSWDGSDVYGEVRDRTKDSFTVDGNKITGEDGENVYKMEEYNTDSGKFTGQMVAKPESSLSKWNGPQNASDIEGAALSMEFDSHEDELDEVYSKWLDHVNMTASGLDTWSDHPCANTASIDPQAVRERNMMLLETNKSEWTKKHIKAAKRTISFISRMRGQRPENPKEGGKGTCPSKWAVSLLNWAYNPFDSIPGGYPNPEQENAARLNDAELAFSASAIPPERKELIQDFNEYGIRRNVDDEGNLVSVDAVFEAMEPGAPENRNGVRITKEFLQSVAEKDYSNKPPYLMDHTKETLSQIGFVKDVWFNESTNKLMVMARAYNTGSQTHDEIIKRLTFEPPTLQDGSVGFGSNYEAEQNDDGETELVDGKLREFSTTPFPAGYDDGGLKTNYGEDDPSEAGTFVVAS